MFTVKFADDSTFIGSAKNRHSVELLVNTELEKINNWFVANRLTLHPNKSKFLVHSRDKLITIRLNNIQLQRSGYGLQEESVKLLGVEIDENLDWKRHIQAVMNKISKGNYLLWRHGNKLTIPMKKTLYESFIRCHLLYGITVWGGATTILLRPLEKLISKTWSKIGNYRMHTLNRLQKYNLLKLKDELRLQEIKLIWKWEKKKTPISLGNILVEKRDNLRGRRFIIDRKWKPSSISHRLASRANKEISSVAQFNTKMTLTKHKKHEINQSYSFVCRTRNCFICGNRTIV